MRLSIATRIFLVFAALVTVFGAVSTFAVSRMHAVGADIRLVSEGYLPLTKVAAQLDTFHKNKQRDTDRLLEEKDSRAQRILIKLARLYYPRMVREKLIQGHLLVTEARSLSGKAERPFLDEIEGRLDELEAAYDRYDAQAEILFTFLESSEVEILESPPAADERGKELKRLERRIDRDLRLLNQALEDRIQERVREAQATEHSSSLAIIGFSLLAIGLGILASLLSMRLLAPIQRLTEAAVRIGGGDYSAQVPTSAANEVGVLAREFNQMAASLQARERELREKQEALLRAEKLATVGKMAAQITHEIRNPLSSIGLNAELLAEELPEIGADEARRLTSAIAREVDRLAEITEEYLHYARLPTPSLSRENLSELIRDLVAFVGPELDAGDIRLELDLPEQLPVLVDENQLRQALLNLLRNAREAMPDGGLLQIAAEEVEGGGIDILIRDTGVGMEPEAIERMFDPFYTSKAGGTGLGLSLTQQIIAQHGGEVSCESEPSRGSTFKIHLPLRGDAPRELASLA